MKKRLLALLLSGALILSLTTPALANLGDGTTEPPAEPQQTETVEKCECGLELGHDGECTPAENDDQSDSENNTDTTNEENINGEGEETPESCACGLAYEHEGDCQLCECGLVKNHEGDCALCDCGLTKNHEGDCAKCDCGLMKNHKGECDKCNCGLIKNHKGDCQEYCSCGAENAFHGEKCDFYVAPEDAAVYTLTDDGEYVLIEGYSAAEPINVETYNGQTVYVLADGVPQNVYFERYNWFGIWYGAYWSANNALANVVPSGKLAGDTYRYAAVTLAEDIPADTEITLTANTVLGVGGTYAVTIKVIEEIPEKEPEREEIIAEVMELMDDFVEVVDEMPEAMSVSEFDDAIDAYAEAHTYITRDLPLLEEDVDAYATAYDEFAVAMGYDADSKEFTYPEIELVEELKADVMEAMVLLYDAEDVYATLPQAQVMMLSLGEEGEIPSVVELDASYGEAKAKLDAIIEAKPDLLENDVALMAMDLGNGVSTVDAVPENIKMNLFNYGPKINTQNSGYGLLPFIHSEGTYGWAVDSTGNNPSGAAGGWPMLQTTLTAERKFPYVTEDKTVIKKGSLGHLFDPAYSGAGRISLDTYKANILSATQNPYQYGSVYLPIENDDGSGTGLFQKEGDYFVYDSGKNAAWYNPDTQKFELYNYVVRPAYTIFSTAATNGNFLPFNQGHTAGEEDYQSETYVKEYSYIDSAGETVKKTATVAKTDVVSTKPDGARMAYRLKGNSRATEVDLWFGMNLEFDFYMPEGGMKNGSPMEFQFLGDDDVWVYIDDVLVLDIGGTHGAESATINFASGVVNNPTGYGQYGTGTIGATSDLYTIMKAARRDSLDESQFIDSDGDGKLDTFKDYTKHNLKFYYMERGGNISYCKLKFNMDPLPTGSVSVEKQLDTNENIADNQTYQFKISAKNAAQEDVKEIPYKIYNVSDLATVVESGTIEIPAEQTDGSFSLKAGQKIFFDLPVGTATITEVTDSTGNIYGTPSWKLNGTSVDGESIQVQIGDGSSDQAEYICVNDRKSGDLKIQKSFSGAEYGRGEYDMTVSFLDGSDYVLYTGNAKKYDAAGQESEITITDGCITLKKNEYVIIPDVPTGSSFKVTEDTLGASFKAPTIVVEGGTVISGTDWSVSGTSSAKAGEMTVVSVTNSHSVGILTITKVISDKKNPDQNFRFTVENEVGTLKMEVIIPAEKFEVGTASVIVSGLPVGTYTVTEDTAWSWRYDLAEGETEERTVVVTGNDGTVTFTNERTEDQWLDGETWCRNIFKDEGYYDGKASVIGSATPWTRPEEPKEDESTEE